MAELDDRIPTFEDDDTGPEVTPVQYALMDAVRDVALSADAPGATYATRHLVRLMAHAFGYPLPEPAEREGGLAGFLYGNPVKPDPEDTSCP